MEAACRFAVGTPQVQAYIGAGGVTNIQFVGLVPSGNRYGCSFSGVYQGQLYNPIGSYGQAVATASACPAGWYVTPAGCVQTLPKTVVTPEEFEDALSPRTLPDAVPQHLPLDLPVEQPRINPLPFPDGTPSPFLVPQGDPRLVPNSDPQQWETPAVRVSPSPTQNEPWRVDTTPVNVRKPTPEPLQPLEPLNPDTPEPQDRTPDLCEKYPDILACQKIELDTPDAPELPTIEKPMSMLPDSGWGPDNAVCPPPRHLQMLGQNIPVPFDLFCTYMAGMRPIIIAMAWLSAAFILVRRND